MATQIINTTGCNSDYVVSLSIPNMSRTFLTVLTIKDSGSNASFFQSNSIVISTTSGYSFYGGGNSEYIRRSGDSLTFAAMTSNWVLINTYAYTAAGHALLSNVSTTNMFNLGAVSISTLTIKGNFTHYGPIDQQNLPTLEGIPVVNQSNLISTVEGLGSLGYFSSVPTMMSIFISTLEGLSGYPIGYISSTQLQSTVAGLGSPYVSTGALTSTIAGIGLTYVSTGSLTSTNVGLGTYGYISGGQLVSTVRGLGTFGYISSPQVISTVNSLLQFTASNNASTFVNIGLLYISTPSLVSTVLGASNTYINSNQLASTILGVTPYYSVPIVSTIAGLGSAGYISTLSLYSTVAGIIASNESNVSVEISSIGYTYVSSLSLQSTVDGLGIGFISLSQLTSTTTGALDQSQGNMHSTVAGIGQIYISTTQFFSTAAGLSNAAATSILSTLNGLGVTYISSLTLQSTVSGLGNYYISIDQLTSTTSNIVQKVGNSLPSTLDGLGSIGYISFTQTISTVGGIADFNRSNLISTVSGLGNSYVSSLTLQSTVAGLGQIYISIPQLTSTTSNVLFLNSNDIQSTFAGLGTAGYISFPHMVSTVIGFSNIYGSNLISTTTNYGSLYISSPSLRSTVNGLGTYGYVSLSQLNSTTESILGLPSNYIQSTFIGLSNLGYVSISQLSSTLIGLRELDTTEFISAVKSLGQTYISSLSLQSTVAGLGTFGYVSLASLISTTNGLIFAHSNILFNNFVGIGSLTFISTSQLTSTVVGMLSNTERIEVSTVTTFGRNFISSASLQAMVNSLGSMNFVTPNMMNAAFDKVNNPAFIVNPTLGPGFTSLEDKVNASIVGVYLTTQENMATTLNLATLNRSNFISTVNTLDSNYLRNSIVLTSTVNGLGNFNYISRFYLISTVSSLVGVSAESIASTFDGLGTAGYISSPQLISSTTGVLSNDSFFISTVDGIGSLYISSLSLQSTVSGLSNYYTTTVELTSSRVGLSNPTTIPPSMFSSVAGLGGDYISSLSIQSTVAGLGSLHISAPTFGSPYISTMSLVSTVNGLGTFGYLSTGYLTSTFTGYSNPMPRIISTTAGLGKFYISSPAGIPILPDLYRSETKYIGKAIRVMARSSSFLFFADASNIYKSSFNPIVPVVFASLSNVTGMACDNTFLHVSYRNTIVNYYLANGLGPYATANVNNTAGFENYTSETSTPSINSVSFRSIQGICIDSTLTTMYVCDTGNNAIRRVQIYPMPFSVTTVERVNQPYSVIVDPLSQYLYVSGADGITKICLFQSNTTLLSREGAYSRGMHIDSSGTLAYVTSQINSCVLEVNLSNGNVNPLAGTSDSPGFLDGTASLFYSPQGILYNPIDTFIYVADTGNSAIRQIMSRIYYSTIQGMNQRGYTQAIGLTVPTINNNVNSFLTPPSLQLWLDAADPNGSGSIPPTNIPANGSTLSIWRDKSGNSNHAMPVNTPLYFNRYIQLPANSYFVSPYLMNSTEHHIFMVCQYSNSGTYEINLVSGMSNACLQVYIYNNTLVLGSPYSSQNRITVLPNLPFLVEIYTTASYSQIFVNTNVGSNGAAYGAGYVYDSSVTQIGGSITNMNICEVFLYNRIVESFPVADYLYQKWIIPALAANAAAIAANVGIISSNLAINNCNSDPTLINFVNSSASIVRKADIALWLDGSDPNGNGIVPAAGSILNTWVDKSGKGNNATGSGVVSTNGIVFGGNNYFNTPILTNSSNTVMYVVFSNTTSSTYYEPLIGASEGSNTGYELLIGNDYLTVGMSYPANTSSRFTDYSGGFVVGTSINLSYATVNTQVINNMSPKGSLAVGKVTSNNFLGFSDELSILVADFTEDTYVIYNGVIQSNGQLHWGGGVTAFGNMLTSGILTYGNIQIACFMPCGVVINEGTSIKVISFEGSSRPIISFPLGANKLPVCIAGGPGDTFVTIRQDGAVQATRLKRNSEYVGLIGGFYESETTVHCGWVLNYDNPPYNTLATSIVYNPVNGKYYYTVYVTVWEISALDLNVKHTVVAGSDSGFVNGKGTSASFKRLAGITVDSYGNLYVVDRENNAIRKISIPGFIVTTIARNIGQSAWEIAFITRDNNEYIYTQHTSNPGELGEIKEIRPKPQIVSSTVKEPAGSNIIVSAAYSLYSVQANSSANSNVPSSNFRIPQTTLAPNSNTSAAAYGTVGTFTIGVFYNPLPIFYTGSIQEIIIYTFPDLGPSGVLPYPRQDVEVYLNKKWNRNYSPYYGIFRPLLSERPYVQTAPSIGSFVPPGILSGTPITNNLTISGSTLIINSNLYAGNITAGSIQGNLYGDGSAVTSISDRRLKEHIIPIMNALEKVSSMQAVKYRLYKDPSRQWIGYIAQDLEVILPEVVRTDSEGWKSIQYTNLPALIIEAVKELNEKYARIKYLLSTST